MHFAYYVHLQVELANPAQVLAEAEDQFAIEQD